MEASESVCGILWGMEMRLSSNVADLSDEQRTLLESLIGLPLQPEQVLYWIVANPGTAPSAADKDRARTGIQELFAKVDRHAEARGIGPDEFGSAVDEAVRDIRSRLQK